MLDSSFNFGSTTLRFIHLSKVPLVHLSIGVLTPEVAADIIKMESKSLSWLVSLSCGSPIDLPRSCLPDAELFQSNGEAAGWDRQFLNCFSLLALFLKSHGEQSIPMGTLSAVEAGGLVTLGLPCPQRVFWLQASWALISSQPSASVRARNSHSTATPLNST